MQEMSCRESSYLLLRRRAWSGDRDDFGPSSENRWRCTHHPESTEQDATNLARPLLGTATIRPGFSCYFFGCAVGGSNPLRRRYMAAEL